MKYFYIIIFFIYLNYGFSKISKPYNEGSEHSVLFSTRNSAEVLHEDIIIDIKSYFQDASNIYNDYYAHYKIIYHIHSNENQIFPLLFIATNLKRSPILININGKNIKKALLTNTEDKRLKGHPFIKSTENENIYVLLRNNQPKIINIKDVVYFEAFLNKGKNIISLEYNSNIESNNSGFVKNYYIDYSLSPCKYWKSFGPIHIELNVPDNLNIIQSSIGMPLRKKNTNYFYWNLEQVPHDMEITISPRISLFSNFLLTIGPSGFISIIVLLFSLIHIYFIKKYRETNIGYNWALTIGNFLNPCLFYILYFSSFVFIEWTLGNIALRKYKHIYFILFTFPITLIIYTLFMWIIDLNLKNKFSLV